jgi:hypothetical protein
MRTLAKRLKIKSFDDNSYDGFVIDRVRDDCIEARYIEKVEYIDKVIDPFGKELSFERVEFKQCEFRAASYGAGLELIDAPRSTQGLISRLIEATDFSLAITPMSINVLSWATFLQENMKTTGVVDSLQIGSLELEQGISAKIVLKGDKDVRNASKLLTKEKSYSLEKIQLRFTGLHNGTLLLTNIGAVKIDMVDASDLVVALRNSLTSALK